ncbi:GPI anchored serine-threonine rich protein [Penicillium canescens]|nr:GPI anchored serine-threonine rich protein [Penicillium canescens]
MRFTIVVVSFFAALAAAYTQPNYSRPPQGNAIASPGLNEQVPKGKPYEIKWDPTLGDRISLVLLRGPSSNVKPLETIVENISNSGHYTWTPSTGLTPDVTHYGLLLVVEDTGAYQWSTQFGISKLEGSSFDTSTLISDITTNILPEKSRTAPVITPTVSAAFVPVSHIPHAASTMHNTSVTRHTASVTISGILPPVNTGAAGRNTVSLGAVMASFVVMIF